MILDRKEDLSEEMDKTRGDISLEKEHVENM